MINEIQALTDKCTNVLDLNGASLPDEYFYQSVPLCIIDAVFSIGVRYTSVQNVVSRFCEFTGQTKTRNCSLIPNVNDQYSVEEFCMMQEQDDPDLMAESVYKSRHRTSPKNGILKAQATHEFAKCLKKYGVNCFQDLHKVIDDVNFSNEIKQIKGQTSGISLQYFWMLAGSESLIKPDRMIIRFISDSLSREIRIEEALPLLQQVSVKLQTEYPRITPRLLDYKIWEYQREINNT